MNQIIIIIHVIVGLCIIGLVMMQQGKGADAGAAFGSGGGGASGTLFGASGSASFLSRTTAVFAILFFSTSLGLAFLGGNREEAKELMDVPVIEEAVDLPPVGAQEGEDVPAASESAEMPAVVQEAEKPVAPDESVSGEPKAPSSGE
ncbi:MAG: preprotein translocase subunit SecG [Gammaproteobacteria bacterium]